MTPSTTRLLAIVSVTLLIAALLPLPYAYYQVLRWLICLSAGTLGAIRWNYSPYSGSALILVAIVFNPITPMILTRGVWAVVDVLGAAIFLWVALKPAYQPGR